MDRAAGILGAMTAYFPEATVPAVAIARLEDAMTNDPKDRHVLAAAVAAPAEAVVTFNLSDFAEDACAPYSVAPTHPDEFLMTLYEITPTVSREVITDQASELTRPPVSRDELLDYLRRAGVPRFADAVR